MNDVPDGGKFFIFIWMHGVAKRAGAALTILAFTGRIAPFRLQGVA